MIRLSSIKASIISLLIAPLFFAVNAFAVGLDDKVGGYSLDDLAKAFAKQGDIRANYGEANQDGPFDDYLRKEFGSGIGSYDQAYQLWHDEWEKDESGKLEARFSTLMSSYTVKFQMADTKDMSQEVKGGVTLETYAKVAVALSQQANPDVNAILKQNGIASEADWQKASQSWVQAMTQDRTIATQYGLLYQKLAGPSFAAEQEQRLADQLGGRFDDEAEDSEEDEQGEAGVAFYAKELSSPVNEDRWYAADRMLYHCSRFRDWGDDDGEGLEAHCNDKAINNNIVPVLKQLLGNFENGFVEQASGVLNSVKEMKLENEVGKQTVVAALNRAQQQHAEIKAKYDPVQFKNVPEKALLRSRMDATAYSIEEFQDHLSDW